MIARPLLALAALAGTTGLSHADETAAAKPRDPKYAAIDAARAKLIAALDAGDAAAFAEALDATPVEVKDVWFDAPKCRKQFKKASLTTKTAPAFVACMKGLHVYATGLMTYYGPGVELTPRFDYVDGRAVLRRMYGDAAAVDPSVPTIPKAAFESHRTEGSAVVFDKAAKDEIAAAGDTGVVIEACADAKGKVAAKAFMPPIPTKGAAAKAIYAALATWKLEPFTVRDKPAAVCSMVIAK